MRCLDLKISKRPRKKIVFFMQCCNNRIKFNVTSKTKTHAFVRVNTINLDFIL